MTRSILSPPFIVNLGFVMWLTKLAVAVDVWAFPPTCVLCGDAGAQAGFDLCAACEVEFPYCEQPATATPPLDLVWSAFHYEFPVAGLVRELKFTAHLAYARVLGLACLHRWQRQPSSLALDCLMAVPLHVGRLRTRGFNQSVEIAQPLARGLRLPLLERAVMRTRATQPQTLMPAESRHDNVHGAFDLLRPVQGLRIGVVDDVLTTGATLQELGGVLKAGGASYVMGLTVARARG